MNKQSRHSCNSAVLQKFLGNRLSREEQLRLETHLDGCNDCCRQLNELTANDEQWLAVQDHLGERASHESLTEQPTNLSLSFLNASDDPHMLGRFGGYEIAGVIGSGGMGMVLKGFDRALNRFVAIKVLLPHYAGSAAARQRFAREARAAAAVVHDNVIEIYGVSAAENGTLPHFVMPYIRGESLEKRLERCGTLSVSETLRISIQIASGLAAAHEQGLVHRDIKPANILLLEDVERVQITDFGLARAADDASLTRSGVIAGTPQYMSPEQAEGGHLTTHSDLFSLGSVMYSMCTGRLPFRAETPIGIIRRILDENPRPIPEINSDVPNWLCQIIEKLHSKSPEQRFRSAEQLAKLLKQCLAHVEQPHDVPLPDEIQSCDNSRQTKNDLFDRKHVLLGVLTMVSLFLVAFIGSWLSSLGFSSLGFSSLGTSNLPEPPTSIAGALVQDRQSFSKRFTATFADSSKVGTLSVDIKRGAIRVESHDHSTIIVDLEVPDYHQESASSDGLKELRPKSLDFKVTSHGNAIKVDSNSQRYITNLHIKVPRDVNLILDSYRDGQLHVEKVNGHLSVQSFHSDITLSQCSGSASVYSYHGDLAVSLDSISSDKPLKFESYNGSIDLTFPPEVRLNTHTRTNFGKLLTDFDIEEVADEWQTNIQKDGSIHVESDEFVHGKINGGGQKLLVETEHGDIRIRRQKTTSLGERIGREWNEKLGKKLGAELNSELGPKLGQEWNEKLGPKLGREWDKRFNKKDKK